MLEALLLIDHGSRRAEANESLACMARLIAFQLGESSLVRHAHMELAEPTIEQGFDACVTSGAGLVIAVPYMLAPGRHSTADIPQLVARAAARHRGVTYRVGQPLGVDPCLGELVIKRAGLQIKRRAPDASPCAGDVRRCGNVWCGNLASAGPRR